MLPPFVNLEETMKIFVSGLVNIETTVAVRGFPIEYYPIDYPFFGVESHVSGVGYNVAKALTTLGDEVCFYSYTGQDDEADRIKRRMRFYGICPDKISPSLKSTPASAVLYDPNGRRQIYCDLKDIQEQSIDIAEAEPDLAWCDAAVLCNIGFNRGLIKRAKELGALTATDVHVLCDIEDDYNRGFMENADILFLSDEGLPCAPEDFIRRLYERYHSRVIVIGMGAKGALLLDGGLGEMCLVPAYSGSRVVNTVGAGDALFSSFLHFYVKGMKAADALKRAVVFAGIKIESSGASEGFVGEEEIEKRMCK